MSFLRTRDSLENIRQLITNRVLGQNVNLSFLDSLKNPDNLLNLLALRGTAFRKREEEKVRRFLADFFAGEIVQIADNNADIAREDEDIPDNKENVARSKLRIDTRKWLMEHLAPGFYSHKLQSSSDKSSGSVLRAKVYLPENGRS